MQKQLGTDSTRFYQDKPLHSILLQTTGAGLSSEGLIFSPPEYHGDLLPGRPNQGKDITRYEGTIIDSETIYGYHG